MTAIAGRGRGNTNIFSDTDNAGIGTLSPSMMLHLSVDTPKVTLGDTETGVGMLLRTGGAVTDGLAGLQIILSGAFSISTNAQAN